MQKSSWRVGDSFKRTYTWIIRIQEGPENAKGIQTIIEKFTVNIPNLEKELFPYRKFRGKQSEWNEPHLH